MPQTYGIDTAIWVRLPPDDQAAVKAAYLGQPTPQIGAYAEPSAAPAPATPPVAVPAATSAPPPTLSSLGAQAFANTPADTKPPTKPVVTIVKPIEKATTTPTPQTTAHTLEARLDTVQATTGKSSSAVRPASGYYTYRDDVPLKPGQTLGYTPGKGYYASVARTPAKATNTPATPIAQAASVGTAPTADAVSSPAGSVIISWDGDALVPHGVRTLMPPGDALVSEVHVTAPQPATTTVEGRLTQHAFRGEVRHDLPPNAGNRLIPKVVAPHTSPATLGLGDDTPTAEGADASAASSMHLRVPAASTPFVPPPAASAVVAPVIVYKPAWVAGVEVQEVRITTRLSKSDALDLLEPTLRSRLKGKIENKITDKVVELAEDALHLPTELRQAISLLSTVTDLTIARAAHNYAHGPLHFSVAQVRAGAPAFTTVLYTFAIGLGVPAQIKSVQANFLVVP